MKNCFIILLMCWPLYSKAQTGGRSSFEFLNVPVDAIVSAQGGYNISLIEQNPMLLFNNPALSDSIADGAVGIGWLSYFAGINQSSAAYVHDLKGQLKLHGGLSYLGYGEFDGYDPTGNPTHKFNANEYAVIAGVSHQLSAFTLGLNIKFAHSLIDSYSSSALLFDLGGTFKPGPRGLSVAIVAKNLGWLLSHAGNLKTTIPFDLQLGLSLKPQYMPIRFSFTGYNLTKQHTRYFDNQLNPGESRQGIVDEFFRHINIGAELLLSKNFQIRAGYNHQRRKELRLQDTSGGAGFSFGFLLRVKKFNFSYGRSAFHTAGGTNHLTLATNMKNFKKKKNL